MLRAIIGDIDGQLSVVLGKLAKLQDKQSFAFAIIAGNLFADPDQSTEADTEDLIKLLENKIEVPLPTYFALGKRPLPDAVVERLTSHDGELCPNLSILGRNVSIKTSEGVRIVAIGGAHTGQGESLAEYAPFHSDKDITQAKEYKDTDILITADWPEGMRNGSGAATAYSDGEAPSGDRSIADLCAALKPRFHFSTSSAYFEREPFFHPGDAPLPVTRFLSLPPYGNPHKQKWIYGFNLIPSAPAPQELPATCTASPFTSLKKRKLPSQETSYSGFRFAQDSNGTGDHYRPNGHSKKRRQNGPPSKCYFCLAGDDVALHMVCSIGDDAYLTTSKGPLTVKSSFPDLSMHSHMLIIPLSHHPTFQAMGDDGPAALAQMNRYREALQTMISAKSSGGADGKATLGAVTYEISRTSGVHLQWQFLPVPVEMIQKGMVEAAFDVEAENFRYGSFAKDDVGIRQAEEGDYFKVMIWSEAGEKVVVLPLQEGVRFDLQFGRGVLGKLLSLEKRRHWRDCEQTVQEEEADAEAFKAMFKEYDFTMTD